MPLASGCDASFVLDFVKLLSDSSFFADCTFVPSGLPCGATATPEQNLRRRAQVAKVVARI